MLITSPRQNKNGRWKMIEYSDEAAGVYRELCDCTEGHATADDAKNCPQAKAVIAEMFPPPPPSVKSLNETISKQNAEIARLRGELIKISRIACGEDQVADDDSEGMGIIYKISKVALFGGEE